MLERIRPHLTYANVMSSIAVFAVLGGGAYAGIDRKIRTGDLQNRAVTTKKVKKQAVRTGLIAPEAVRTGKLADGAVSTDKIADLAVETAKLADQAVATDKLGDEAVTTDKLGDGAVTGAKADESTFGLVPLANQLGSVTVQREEVNVPAGGNGAVAVECPEGQQALGGGARAVSFLNFIVSSRPQLALGNPANPENGQSFSAWRAASRNTGGAADTLHVWAICAG